MKNKTGILGLALTAVIVLVMIACDISGNQKKEVDNSKYYLNPPTGIVATILPNNTILFTWDAASGAGEYEISVRTNLDSADTRRYVGKSSITRYERNYYSWLITDGVTTFFYYFKTHPSRSGYIASGWSDPVPVNMR